MTENQDDDFNGLNRLNVPLPTPEARRRALGASLMAFDRQQEAKKESAAAPQGSRLLRRLKSMVPPLKGNWIMDSRRLVPAGTAVFALLILAPLGYQLYSSTALTPPKTVPTPASVATPTVPPQPRAQGPLVSADAAPKQETSAVPMKDGAALPQPAIDAARSSVAGKSAPAPVMEKPGMVSNNVAAGTVAPTEEVAVPAMPDTRAAPGNAPAPPPAVPVAAGALQSESLARLAATPAIGPRAMTQATGDKFQNFAESPLKAVATDPVSTFSIDVDTASYSYVRRSLNEGRIPAPDTVRIEEMINYFPYDYPPATSASEPFKPTISVFPTPWNPKTELMQIGIKGYEPPVAARKPSNLVFLIDTSGSMDEPDKLPLLQRALGLLVATLSPKDTVSIVAYAGSAGVVLDPTPASDKAKIMSALDNLSAGGSTAGAEGIELAYDLAAQHKTDGNNRVILATDGDFNVGISDPEQLKQFIKQKRASGIGLSVLGFGEGNLDDQTMQALAQNGDGNASYIDTLSEAQKVLVKEAGSTLDTIAKDVKIQVEFNPATVSSYRLIGYETRALNREDFNNDKVDAGDVGAGHSVTALYEITPAGQAAAPAVDPLRYGATPTAAMPAAAEGRSAELADLKLRYKLPGSDTSRLIEQPVTPAMVVTDIAKASDDARWAAAVAAFGQKLKGSDYAGGMSYAQIKTLAAGARGNDPDGYRSEFLNLVGLAGALTGGDASSAPDGTAPSVR